MMGNNLSGADGGAWSTSSHATLYPVSFNKGMAEYIIREIKPDNVLEFGSGMGYVARYINESIKPELYLCIEPNHIDGNYDSNSGPFLLELDIFQQDHPEVINRKFELVMSIEVAEHIAIEQHEVLFDFLVSRTNKWIVFSGARPGQGGFGHIAERPEDEWRSEFIKRGMLFDAERTNAIRASCDEKNINHRKNLMVFRRPSYGLELDRIEHASKPHLRDICQIVRSKSEYLVGNLFYVCMKDAVNGMPNESLRVKRENFLDLVKGKKRLLLIGFNAGHSTLLALLGNSSATITVIDICELPYVKECAQYLNKSFPGRLEFIFGNSVEVLPIMSGRKFDFIHYDGGKDKTISADLELTESLVEEDHVLLIDDTHNAALKEIVSSQIKDGKLNASIYAPYNHRINGMRWPHMALGFSENALSAFTKQSLQKLSSFYSHDQHPSLYTLPGAPEMRPGYNRALSLISLLHDVRSSGIKGDFVECGVAAGHSAVMAADVIQALGMMTTNLYLYDTFEGFCFELPAEKDMNGKSIGDYDLSRYTSDYTSMSEVRKKVLKVGIDEDRVHLIKGKVEDIVPADYPQEISVLRLDMDLYQPTLHCLEHFYPRLSTGGYLIVDGYGHWQGCRQAVDEYFSEKNLLLEDLVVVDYACRVYRKMTDQA